MDDETTTPFLTLPDEVLFDVMDLCDNETLVSLSETCKRLQILLQGTGEQPPIYGFHKIDKKICVANKSSDEKCSMTPLEVHKMMRLIGQHFETLEFEFNFNERNFSDFHDMIVCYMEQAAKYCPNVQKMTLSFEEFKQTLIKPLFTTVFANLHILELSTVGDQINLDLMQCPNIRKLKAGSITPIKLTKCWPTLEKLIILKSIYTPELMELIEKNPQLKRLKVAYGTSNFREIVKCLPNIEKVTIRIAVESSFLLFDCMKKWKKLSKLTLELNLQNRRYLTTIEKFLPFMKSIKKLKINFYRGYPRADDNAIIEITTIAAKFPNLGLLKLMLFQMTPEHVSQLKRNLPNLKIELCDYNIW